MQGISGDNPLRHVDKMWGALLQRPKSWGAVNDPAPPVLTPLVMAHSQRLESARVYFDRTRNRRSRVTLSTTKITTA